MYNFNRLKYKYYIKTNSNNINKVRNILVYDLVISKENLFFYTNDISNLDKNMEYEIILDRDTELHRLYKKYIGLVLGMTVTVVVLFLNSIRYNEIIFTEKINDKESIIEYIEEKTNNILNIKYLNEDILDINVDIRNKFTNLEWISIDKVGTDIYVSTVRKNNIEDKISDNAIGDLVASVDAVVRLVNVKQGRLLVLQNQFIEKGKKLVSANLNEIYEGQEPKYVKSQGIVLGEYEDTVEYKIPIKENITRSTGKIDSYININVFGFNFNIGKNSTYKKKTQIKDEKFNILGLIKISKVQDIEKNDIIIGNTKETAIIQVEDIIYSNFENTRVHDDENIFSITVSDIIEEDGYYRILVHVHQIKNIAVFSEFIPEESND